VTRLRLRGVINPRRALFNTYFFLEFLFLLVCYSTEDMHLASEARTLAGSRRLSNQSKCTLVSYRPCPPLQAFFVAPAIGPQSSFSPRQLFPEVTISCHHRWALEQGAED
jgi:hypothetical protein